jgi:nitrite reductase/ring-hydroxylating ferredoxin subunit
VRRRKRGVDAYLDAVAQDNRPPRFPADDAEVETMLAAAALKAGRPGADSPDPRFVEKLERRLRKAMEAPGAVDDSGAARVSRRRLLGGAAVAAAAAVGAGIGVDRLVIDHGDSGPGSTAELVPGNGHWVDVAALADVVVGQPLRFSAGAMEGYLVNHGDRIQAVSAICTHMPCTLNYDATHNMLDCPCHRAWFGMDGTPVDASYPYPLKPLPTLRTKVLDGRVHVLTA